MNLLEYASWIHPLCEQCWDTEHPGHEAAKIRWSAEVVEVCCMCGQGTTAGIYVRRDPATVYFRAARGG